MTGCQCASSVIPPRTSQVLLQTSREGESHAQEANVAEVSYGQPVTGEPESLNL
jgi:hypothetical protein